MRRLRRAYQRNARQEAKRRKKFRQRAPLETQMKHSLMGRRKKSLTGRAVAAGTAAAITLGAGVCLTKALAHTPDIHELPVSQDADADLLADKEELAIGYCVFKADQNCNEIPDGVELAKRCAAIINKLPEYEEGITETYRADHPCFGIELCDICGQQVNMCGVEIINPQLGLTIHVNYIALHYMEHGSFDYGGHSPGPPYEPINSGRTDLQLLMRVLQFRFPYDPNGHQLPLDYVVHPVGRLAPDANDLDDDLLADSEELKAGYDLHDPDQDNDLTPDGIELAKQCAVAINGLPLHDTSGGSPAPKETYKVEHIAKGNETCHICAAEINMGFVEVINPQLDSSIEVPFMSVHYIGHGSFSYAGSSNSGRIDIARLAGVLEMPRRCGDLATRYLPADLNQDCKVGLPDVARLTDEWLERTDPNLLPLCGLSQPPFPYEPNDHQLPLTEDVDADLLADKEELAIGYRPFKPDQNRNQIPDGVELAERCAEVIDRLPQIDSNDPPPNETYKVEHRLRGDENCLICGVPVNMGTLEIVNPPLGLRVDFPILSLHYMGHGSFSYDGTTNTGRTNVPLLLRTLELRFPYDPNAHQSPVDASDLDEDFLTDSEELKAGYNLHDSDQDNDLTPDGIELAKRCAAVVRQLPEYYLGGGDPPNQTYKMEHALDGLEKCDICGKDIHMGGWEIVNPKLGLHYPDRDDPLDGMFLPDLALHYMGHGSFNCFGDYHSGRVDIPLLAKILEIPRRCGDLGTLYLPADLNEDCRVNFTDFAELADKWLECTDPNQDRCTEH